MYIVKTKYLVGLLKTPSVITLGINIYYFDGVFIDSWNRFFPVQLSQEVNK